MKKVLVLLLFVALKAIGISQNVCDLAYQVTQFEPNNISTTLAHGNTLWWERYNQKPPASQATMLYSGSIWIGGLGPSGNLKLSAEIHEFAFGSSGAAPGPYFENGMSDPLLCETFNTHWRVTRSQIQAFKLDFEDNGVINNNHPAITSWPGKGNPNFSSLFGVTLPFQSIAPFVDMDGDGLYNPSHGDYPDIKGDDAVWWIFHDDNTTDATPSNSSPVNFEVQVMAYAFYDDDPVLNNTTFYEITLVNKSNEPLESAYVGLFLDADVGCGADDYVGCLPSKRLAFAYNADALDGQTACFCDGGVSTFCDNIPVLGVKLLDDFDNDPDTPVKLDGFAVITNPNSPLLGNPAQGNDPNNGMEYYRLLQSRWRNDVPFTTGGSGYQSGGATTSFLFPDLPSNPNGWSMCTAGRPPSDYRMMMNVGPHDFQPGGMRRLTFALNISQVSSYPCPDLTPLVNATDFLQQFYNSTITGTQNVYLQPGLLTLYPNPTTQSATLSLPVSGDYLSEVDVYDLQGQHLQHYSLQTQNTLTLERNNLAAGMYLVKIRTHSGKIGVSKLVFKSDSD